jgi:hypothetical protein
LSVMHCDNKLRWRNNLRSCMQAGRACPYWPGKPQLLVWFSQLNVKAELLQNFNHPIMQFAIMMHDHAHI